RPGALRSCLQSSYRGHNMTDAVPTDKPSARKFRMPAEWEPHAATWLAWPQRESDWPGKLAVIPWVYGEIVRALTRHEAVNLIVTDEPTAATATDTLERASADMGRVKFWQLPTD